MNDPNGLPSVLVEGRHRRPKLLVVDDQPVNIHALYEIFSADHDVFMAISGERALALCLEEPPDLVLLDMVMPDMDGLEVCRRLKANPETKNIVVIFVTAHNRPDLEVEGLDVGAVDFIVKPVNHRIVRARVRTHLMLKFHSEVLEATVAERTAELREKLSLIEQQQKSLLMLSTPVIQIWDGVLVLPLIGVIDAPRAVHIMQTSLAEIARKRARFFIMDITGTTTVDSEVVDYLVRTARAAALLGVECMLVGISPRLVLALIRSGARLDKFTTFAALRTGLEEALRRMQYKIRKPSR